MAGATAGTFESGDLVRLRGREWAVECAPDNTSVLQAYDLACIDDDAQGERLRAILEAELDLRRVEDDVWQRIGESGTDNPEIFAAHLRAVTWRSATAADRDLFQAPFRAGIRLDPYQLLPLAKALRLPRVNLLIADDVGLGKTVEAGLVLREMLLRRRVDYVVVSSPAAMTAQWQDELAQKFGLGFTIIDRDYLAAVRRNYGFSANPWSVGSRFIISHSLLADESYSDGLIQLFGNFRPRAMLILDEAHHAAPASGMAYATDSQFTRAVRNLAERFEHRLFLSATPHNGHSNSFSSLLEILDPQRFTRGVPVEPDHLDPVMVRRLKSDLLKLDVSKFPKRRIEPVVLSNLPADTPELVLSDLFEDYRSWCEAGLQGTSLAKARFVMSGLQQRLLSSIPAFARSLRKHLETLKRHRDKVKKSGPDTSATLMADLPELEFREGASEDSLLKAVQDQEDELAEAATEAITSVIRNFDEAISRVEAMLEVARRNERKPDARVEWLVDWIEKNMMSSPGRWNERRLLIFTEWEDTRLWLERRLKEAFEDSERSDERIATFTGITGQDRREQVKFAFNADPAREPLRILLCTDAAREGINLQTRCHDLVHFDLPWNPSRLEQRNGRIDRKLQPADSVTCRYFVYAQRAEDQVLAALVRKTETIRSQLGSAGQVLGERIHRRLSSTGITRQSAAAMAREIEAEDGDAFVRRARRDMADEEEKRLARLSRELGVLDRELNEARERVGIEPEELQSVIRTALSRDGVPLAPAPDLGVDGAFRLDPSLPVFAKDSSWSDLFDELREGRPPKRRQLAEWRAKKPVRAITFDAPVLPDGRDADGVVHVHLEHRLVRRLLSRFVSHGFQAGLNRASVIYSPGTQARVVLIGRLALFGPAAARLHEEILPVTAFWSEAARAGQGLKAFGAVGEETTLAELQEALKTATMPPGRTASDFRPPRDRRGAVRDGDRPAVVTPG
ncbi:DISARM system SNF2-like helicase DrmD [Mesorhizobium sp.]|uniref:DISARM system SNF2-like helicase DrmD n=1 Tax=Mesorhizobium sp. TaxID=1871066 RepID=UPI000FE98444|nr:DISARM system SNF2-like helicase DrmD [Mesorhizobium sp.]RWK66044.1 MAG: ATP-dependent helicase [Mesorhizobium sp.]RWM45101.1 MAG: ATP-dependent helicase [Mesorhizobium sp.]RWM53245.1 MAG: ATP-dependent helicase [Mesorhizobium sp.]RWM62434.1 MAG: ATP-dependent helicase [Mesorhizobium sp.]RWN00219.1 MAG: ATP-dependent helicase [Mesorhizobium sp.]